MARRKPKAPAERPALRTVFTILPYWYDATEKHPAGRGWRVKVAGFDIAMFRSKSGAIAWTRGVAVHLLAAGTSAQIIVHGVDGKIATEWTYGADPVRTKG